MSLYRFARMTALLALLRRYRQQLARMLFAGAFALVTNWVYPDIAQFIDQRHPHYLGWALAAKTLVLYCALFYVLWQLNRMIQGDSDKPLTTTREQTPRPQPSSDHGPLDDLLDKPELRSRKTALLDDERD